MLKRAYSRMSSQRQDDTDASMSVSRNNNTSIFAAAIIASAIIFIRLVFIVFILPLPLIIGLRAFLRHSPQAYTPA